MHEFTISNNLYLKEKNRTELDSKQYLVALPDPQVKLNNIQNS